MAMDDLNSKIKKALLCPRNGRRRAGTSYLRPEVIDALDAIAANSDTNRSDIIWKAIRLYLSAYQNTRPGFIPTNHYHASD